jgi:hypothetical protein
VHDAVIRCAHVALREEIAGRDVDLSLAAQALAAAEELLPYRPEEWAQPASRWESTVVALGRAVVRVQGRGTSRASALGGVLQAAHEIAREAAR